ncbi:protein of unknown function DUF862, eukaryotic [Nannochloropsis gaditana]|uniref:PPPDE domain-containing protein n=1 Tax=Nannochloropsis gaditana TaxID=72520 RepID=W7U0C8_9STRA|nr:protein of unknown function DUF862, eukaryotic [Nannochloropsis gaditana]
MVIICIETKVGGVEYTFAQNGVFFHVPKTPLVASGQVVSLKESIVMGEHVGSANEVHGIINKLREEFAAGAYHVTRKNCNHYSDALCQRLVGASVPAWVNRPARIGSIFSFGGNKDKAKEKTRTEKVSARTKAENAAAKKKKELTQDQKNRLAAIRRTSSSS